MTKKNPTSLNQQMGQCLVPVSLVAWELSLRFAVIFSVNRGPILQYHVLCLLESVTGLRSGVNRTIGKWPC